VGMVGAVWGYFIESIFPNTAFDATFDVALALMAFLGGLGTIFGPILGALILESTQQYFALQFVSPGWYLIAYGALFLIVILLLPRGIIPTLADRWAKYLSTRSQRQQGSGTLAVELPASGNNGNGNGGAENVEKKEGINL
jgi:branched-chain amino acid transport system permease protein